MPILPHFGGRKKFSTDIIFCFGCPPIGKIFACSAVGICPISHHLRVAIALATPKVSEMRERGRQPVIARRKFRALCRVRVPTAPPDAENRTGNGAIFPALHGSVPCHLTCCRRLACCTILHPLGEPNTPPALRRRVCWPLQLQADGSIMYDIPEMYIWQNAIGSPLHRSLRVPAYQSQTGTICLV